MNPSIKRKLILSIVIAFAGIYSALMPMVQAIVPPPDGGYPGNNTAEGQNALFSLTTGRFNTAVGSLALEANNQFENTATGYVALNQVRKGSESVANGYRALALLGKSSSDFPFGNAAMGFEALSQLSKGTENIAIGRRDQRFDRTRAQRAADRGPAHRRDAGADALRRT